MANEEIHNGDEFIITLTLPDQSEREVKVTNPNLTIQDQIKKIVQVFELPNMDGAGQPREYKLGRSIDDCDPEIIDSKDDEGREQCFYDCVKPGDHLQLIEVPIAG